MPEEMSKPDQASFAETTLTRFVMLRLANCQVADKLEDIAASAGFDTLDQLMRIAHGETPVTFEQVPQLAAALGVSAGFVTGLAVAEHWSSGLVDVLASMLPAVSTVGMAEIDTAEDDEQDAQPVQAAGIIEPSFDYARLVLDTGEHLNLNFKVTPAFHKRFRFEAAMAGVSMKRLLEICFKLYFDEKAK